MGKMYRAQYGNRPHLLSRTILIQPDVAALARRMVKIHNQAGSARIRRRRFSDPLSRAGGRDYRHRTTATATTIIKTIYWAMRLARTMRSLFRSRASARMSVPIPIMLLRTKAPLRIPFTFLLNHPVRRAMDILLSRLMQRTDLSIANHRRCRRTRRR